MLCWFIVLLAELNSRWFGHDGQSKLAAIMAIAWDLQKSQSEKLHGHPKQSISQSTFICKVLSYIQRRLEEMSLLCPVWSCCMSAFPLYNWSFSNSQFTTQDETSSSSFCQVYPPGSLTESEKDGCMSGPECFDEWWRPSLELADREDSVFYKTGAVGR